MSLKLSSLAFDNMEEQEHGHTAVMDFEPALSVVKPRFSKSHQLSPSAHLEEVVQIGGRFTISF